MYSYLKLPRHLNKVCSCRFVNTVENNLKIKPPVRIQRGDTDILQALASTVSRDPTAAHYKYHDDPYLTPQSNFHKRSYALSQESGRRAALWIRDEHSELFTTREWDPPTKIKTEHFNADPRIPAFAPRPVYNENSKVSEQDLTFLIATCQVEDAVKVYSLLGGDVSNATRCSLLELICYFNEKEAASEEWIEERWYSAGVGRQRRITSWKVGGLAEELFNMLESKDARCYSAIVAGMAKYAYADRAYELSREALEAGHQLNVTAYNNLIAAVGFLKEGTVQRVQMLKQLLEEMRDQGLTPTSNTLTSCLCSLSGWGGSPQVKELALSLIAEFRTLNIDITLAAFYYALCIFCKEGGPRVDVMTSILNELEKSPGRLVSSDPRDVNFFVTAMAICCEHLQDLDLCERVHGLLMNGNYKLIGDSYKESIYFRNYVSIHCRNSSPERVCELMDQLIPNVYIPEPTVMEQIIESMELGGFGDRLAQCWSQMIVFNLVRRTSLVERLLQAMISCYSHQEDECKDRMRRAAADMIANAEKADEMADKLYSPPPKMSATSVARIVRLCSDVDISQTNKLTLTEDTVWQAAVKAVNMLYTNQCPGVPREPDSVVQFAVRASSVGDVHSASMALRYLAENGHPEAGEGCLICLKTVLNRSGDELTELLSGKTAELMGDYDPNILNIIESYNMCKSSHGVDTSSSSSESDSSGSDSDVEPKRN